MKKQFTFFYLFFLILVNINAATKLKLQNDITILFNGCVDGSVNIEAKAKKSKSPTKEFEFLKEEDSVSFVKAEENIFIWKEYKINFTEEGYTLFYNDKELYSSRFIEEKNLLREIRTWNTAKSFYGFGQASRYVDLSNQSFTIYNVSKYGDHAFIFIPFYISNEGTSVYYNANGKDTIYFQHEQDSQVYKSNYKRIQCYIKQDESVKNAVKDFYKQTESFSMLPKWAFGYIQSKYGYKSQEEVIALIEEFKKRDIPLSAVVLDLFWFNKMGDISWTSKDFPSPKELNSYMEENNVKLITITEPFFTTASVNYEELKKLNLLCKNDKGKIALWRDWWCLKDKESGIFNPLGKNASLFMGNKYSSMLETGIDGFWTDLGEPEKVPETLKYSKFAEIDFHNYYNYYWTKSLFDGVKKHNPNTRLFIMSRSAYTGSTKFNVSIWSGDVGVSWIALKNQIAYGINTGLSALPYWGSDVGGFVQEKTYPELFVRWQQFGAFTPIYRAHGTGSREPWIFTDKETNIISEYIKTRESLIPYIYSTSNQTKDGIPMMRPMIFEDKNTPKEFIESQYFFGDAFLIAPITKEISVENQKQIYLPKGIWFDAFSLKKYTSNGELITVPVELKNIPIFIKDGSIIPCQKDDKSYLFILPSQDESSFTFYNDDGVTDNYKNNDFSTLKISLQNNFIKASVSQNQNYLPKEFTLVIPSNIKVDSSWKKYKNFYIKTINTSDLINGINF